MSWISKLDEYGHNHLIDELVWHLEQGRTPESVKLVNNSELSGYEFSFSELEPMFLKVNPEAIQSSWQEAKEIVSKFNQLQGMRFVHS